MKHTMLALVTVLLCGTLSACKPEPAAPAAEVPAPAAEPTVVEPVVTDPMATPEPAADPNTTDAAEDEDDTPHSGGDKVAP